MCSWENWGRGCAMDLNSCAFPGSNFPSASCQADRDASVVSKFCTKDAQLTTTTTTTTTSTATATATATTTTTTTTTTTVTTVTRKTRNKNKWIKHILPFYCFSVSGGVSKKHVVVPLLGLRSSLSNPFPGPDRAWSSDVPSSKREHKDQNGGADIENPRVRDYWLWETQS